MRLHINRDKTYNKENCVKRIRRLQKEISYFYYQSWKLLYFQKNCFHHFPDVGKMVWTRIFTIPPGQIKKTPSPKDTGVRSPIICANNSKIKSYRNMVGWQFPHLQQGWRLPVPSSYFYIFSLRTTTFIALDHFVELNKMVRRHLSDVTSFILPTDIIAYAKSNYNMHFWVYTLQKIVN